jgi:hypothetical protein
MSLSPGKWHLKVPRDPRENARFRIALLKAAEFDPVLQAGIMEVCEQDILFFINVFIIQFNPKKKRIPVGPFITWLCQEDALLDTPETTKRRGILWYYEHDKSCVIEKSREMGASWLFLIFQLWLGLFHDRVQLLNISRSADAVDCKSPDSLFWKMRFMHEHLPDWMKGKVLQTKMYIEWTRTKSVATGEASTGLAFTGGRGSCIFVDEVSKIKEAAEVRRSTASVSDTRFFNGTHVGIDTEFYRLTQSPEIGKIVLHWTQHPDKRRGLYRVGRNNVVERLDKNYEYEPDYRYVLDGSPTGGPFPGIRSPWYDAKCHDIGSIRGVAVELDIDPKGSDSQFFNALLIHDLTAHCTPPIWEGDLDYDRDLGRPHKLVARTGGRVKLWIMPNAEGTVPYGRYVAGADVASGSGATASCISICDVHLGRKVMEYADPFIEPGDFGVLLVAFAWLFRDPAGQGAHLAWEIPGPGATTGKRVLELGYRNVYCRGNDSVINPRQGDVPGWPNSVRTALDLLEDYRADLKSGALENPSESSLWECLSFRYGADGYVEHAMVAGGDDPSGARVNHADQAMADAIMNKMRRRMTTPAREKAAEAEEPFGSMGHRRKMREEKRKDELAWA